MERFFTKSILLISLLILIPNISRADAVYKWNDALGRVHFGSNPPKDAKNVDPIKNK